jgi:cell division septation protein DedD
MQENAKVFVFEKKEIFLLFVFVLIMSVTCFTLGVNMGKKLALDKSGVTAADVKTVDMKSGVEEDVDKAVVEDTTTPEEKAARLMEDSKAKLNEELKQFAAGETGSTAAAVPATTKPVGTDPMPSTAVTSATAFTGKYTIQLGSYNTQEEAKQFAEGFTVRGYNPIINEVVIPEKGTWYRVSLGIFETTAAAREYIKQEASLFAGQDHVITEIK